MSSSEKNDAIEIEDILYALSYLQASEAGLLGENKLTPYDAGISGALTNDLRDIFEKFNRGEVTKEQTIDKIKIKITTALVAKVVNLIDKVVIEKLISILKSKIPIIGLILENTKELVKKFISEKLTKVANKAYNILKEKFKKIFA